MSQKNITTTKRGIKTHQILISKPISNYQSLSNSIPKSKMLQMRKTEFDIFKKCDIPFVSFKDKKYENIIISKYKKNTSE